MNTTQSNVVGNKTARSCDSCSSKRAIWFCAADDAFLCQTCDTSVHSANQLARRHERARLEKPPPSSLAWHQGITKKPRTPRSRKRLQKQHDDDSNVEVVVLVPEFRSEESFSANDQNEEQYRVPVLDLLDGEISNEFIGNDDVIGKDSEFDLDSLLNDHEVSTMDIFPGFMETDVELEDYLGAKTEEESYKGLSEIGFEGLKVEEENPDDFYCNSVGLEISVGLEMAGESSNWDFEEETAYDFYGDSVGIEMTRDQSSNWDFEDYSSSRVEEKEVREKEKRRIKLKLNHEGIICAWDCQVSPWMNGIKPDFNLDDDDCWFHFMGSGCTLIDEDPNGTKSGRSGPGSGRRDEEREARVLRYKEKRRTRLFAKKIRYQVRKLNAEKRPRMKGRFVKRTAIAASSSLPCYMQMNKHQ